MKGETKSIGAEQDQNGGMCLCENIFINLILNVVWHGERFQKAL
jgi:hypothetical protein